MEMPLASSLRIVAAGFGASGFLNGSERNGGNGRSTLPSLYGDPRSAGLALRRHARQVTPDVAHRLRACAKAAIGVPATGAPQKT